MLGTSAFVTVIEIRLGCDPRSTAHKMSHNSAVVFVPQQNDQTQNGSAKSELSLSPGVSSTAGKGKGKVVPRKGFRSQAVILAKIPLYSARHTSCSNSCSSCSSCNKHASTTDIAL